QQVTESVQAVFAEARERILSGDIDLTIFDEANSALHREALQLAQLLELIEQRPPHVELVFTGRRAPQQLCEVADLVTVMQAEKHPLQKGVVARRGIEY
ncbi:MAG: cob(I)yrinic acid a,c-diamide adenosyltransferase, partial [Desulfuromonas sp.]